MPGIKAIKSLDEERIPVNATLVFTPEQALLAAKAGAQYVSPFAGRVDDRIRKSAGIEFEKSDYFPEYGIPDKSSPDTTVRDYGLVSGVDLIAQIVDIFLQYEFECEVIAASIRNPIQVRESASAGAHIVTLPFGVLKSMVQHPGTADGIDAFTNDLVDEYLEVFSKTENEKGE